MKREPLRVPAEGLSPRAASGLPDLRPGEAGEDRAGLIAHAKTRSPSRGRGERAESVGSSPGALQDEGRKAAARTEKGMTGSAEGLQGNEKAERAALLYAAKNSEAERDFPKALDCYKKALRLDPRNYAIMSNMAAILITTGRVEEALRQAKEALSVNGAYPPALVNCGIASVRLGDPVEGKNLLLKALSADASNRQALVNLALLHESLQDLHEAEKLYGRLAEMRDAAGYLGIARLAEKAGKTADARQAYARILAMDHAEAEARKLAAERLSTLEIR